MKYKILLFIIILILFVILIKKCFYNNKIYLVESFESEKFPPIQQYSNIFTSDECKQIIDLAKPNLFRSKLGVEEKTGIARTSRQTWIEKDSLHCVERASKFVADLTGLPVENQEQWQVLRYEPGQEYKAHFDACSSATDEYNKCLENEEEKGWGKRVYTFFIYLNDVPEGGETYFPRLNKIYKPKQGNAIFWHNLTRDQKMAHPYSEHAGMPVKKGEKWAINVWVRQNPEKSEKN